MALGTADQLFFDQLEATWLSNEQLVEQARANPLENFALVFNDVFIRSIAERMDDNADIFRRILDDPAFQAVVMDHYLGRVSRPLELARPRRSRPRSPHDGSVVSIRRRAVTPGLGAALSTARARACSLGTSRYRGAPSQREAGS